MFGVIVTLNVISLAMCNYRDERNYVCDGSNTAKSVSQWRYGMWMGSSVPLTPMWETLEASHLYTDFMARVEHRHTWAFAQGSPYYFFGQSWGG